MLDLIKKKIKSDFIICEDITVKHVFRAASVFEGAIAKRSKDKHNLNHIKTDYVK